MDAHAVLDRLSALGVTARVEGGMVLIQPASKVPPELKGAVRENKAELLAILSGLANAEALLDRLRTGHQWLLDQHQRWQNDDTTAVGDAEFSRVWNSWWGLDEQLRTEHGVQGCIYGPDGTCPDGFPCQGCADRLAPSVVAQLALTRE